MPRTFPKTLPFAIATLLPLLAHAGPPTEAEMQAMQQRLQAMEAKLEQMQKLLDQRPAPAPAGATGAQWGDPAKTQAEVDTLKQKVARQELKIGKLYSDVFESAGSGLVITGYIDPTYVYNRNLTSSSFQFLNGGDPYTYYNSQNGDVFLSIVKTFGEGLQAPSVKLEIAPSRGDGTFLLKSDGDSTVNSIFHQALMNMPLNDTTAVVAGLSAGYAGYEYYQSTLTNTVSHNLLFDFSTPGSMVGVGLSYANTQGTLLAKAFIGNEEYYTFGARSETNSNRVPAIMARIDYGVSSSLWVGGSAYLGRNSLYGPFTCPGTNDGFGYQCDASSPYSTKAYGQFDLTYADADTQYNAQVDFGTQQNAAWNGGRATWWGLSGLAHRKWVTESVGKIGATFRADYLNNSQNGGGTSSVYIDSDYTGTDALNGFGIAPSCFASDVDEFGDSNNGRNCKGTNRYALTLAFLAYPTDQWTLKSEVRYDIASRAVFQTNGSSIDGNFRKTNTVISLQSVYAF